MIRALHRSPNGVIQEGVDMKKIEAWVRAGEGVSWVDFEGEAADVAEPILSQTFGFHPLAVDDALVESHVPKVDDWGDYLYIVLHEVAFDAESHTLWTIELDAFLGVGYLVTHHDVPIEALQRVWNRCLRADERPLRAGADHLFYQIVDEVVAGSMPVVEAMDEELDRVEDQILGEPTPGTVERIFTLKRAMLQLRRTIGPQREVVNKLARDQYKPIDAGDRVYFRDVYDHLVRLHDINESLRDQASSALETYLSAVNNRLNEVLKTLTLITTLFLPASFVAGFFGMNIFLAERPVDVSPGSPLMVVGILAMLITPLTLYLWVRRRGWL